MSLYDDMDAVKQKSEQVAGWSSGIKLLQSQLQLKKAVQTQPRRDSHRKSGATLAPVIDLKSKKDDDEPNSNAQSFGTFQARSGRDARYQTQIPARDPEWNMEGEYDPMWPNDYEKVVKDLRDIRDREKEKEDEEKRRKNREEREKRQRDRYDSGGPIPATGVGMGKTGFAGRTDVDEEEEEKPMLARSSGAAIAPPPSLQDTDIRPMGGPPFIGGSGGSSAGSSIAAKIMAKYGFKEGQGLGKQEQGISMALQVEKTSKRGGRIIHEKEILMPPPSTGVSSPGSSTQMAAPPKPEPTITEIMKSPTKVVLLRNMVGPGEVDDDLEPEVKDECNTKYGDVIRVIIFEQPNVPPEEAVRIFVEFKRIESAIKAVVDLNGRFFGGRQVRAGFYSWEKLNNLQLLE